MSDKQNFLVVIPTYNEIESLPDALHAIRSTLHNIDVLVVDDNSPDKTGQWVRAQMRFDPNINLLPNGKKGGLGPAYIAGFKWGINHNFDYLIEYDADGQHRAQDLKNLIAAAKSDSTLDLIIGSRKVLGGGSANWSVARKALSHFGGLYSSIMVSLKTRDNTSGLRVYKASLFKQHDNNPPKIDLDKIEAIGFLFQIEMTMKAERAGAKILELPITFVKREKGISKMEMKIAIETLKWTTKQGFIRLGKKLHILH